MNCLVIFAIDGDTELTSKLLQFVTETLSCVKIVDTRDLSKMDQVEEYLESEQQDCFRRSAVELVCHSRYDAAFECSVPIKTSLAILR